MSLGSRIRLNPKENSGAAGTQPKYCGKWGTLGGTVDRKSSNFLDAAIREIQDEVLIPDGVINTRKIYIYII